MATTIKVNGVDRTVLVQTISSLGETREFLATAAANEFIAGVVGWVDLTAPDLAEQLAALGIDARVFKGLDELDRLPLTSRRDVFDPRRNPEGVE